MGDVLCETCLERGRQRLADVVTEDLQMCRDCFNGKPTCREETVGGLSESERRYRKRNLESRRLQQARWRERNRERIRAYWREWRKGKTEQLRKKIDGGTREPIKMSVKRTSD